MVSHITKKGVVKKNPLGKKISMKQYHYAMEVLPPLTFGKEETIAFLETLDKNQPLADKLRRADIVEAFMQGEGFDRHEVYALTNDGAYRVGKTRNEWNTEMFRYNDWRTMSASEIRRYNFG